MSTLARGDVDVWVAWPDRVLRPELLVAYDRLMTAPERKKQRAFVFDKNRRESLFTRALVRTVLSRYRDVAPEDWRFEANEYGRPHLVPDCGLAFNLSNHPSMVACAVTEGVAIGVDLEPIDRRATILDLARSVFAPDEQRALFGLPTRAREDRALTLWTLKESYIKARGMGLSLPLEGFAFHFDEPDPDPRIAFAPAIDDDPERWRFRTLDVEGHRLALAVARLERAPNLVVRGCVPLDPSEDRILFSGPFRGCGS